DPGPEGLASATVPAFTSAGDAVAALAAAIRYTEWLAREEGTTFEAEHDDDAAEALIDAALAGVTGAELRRLDAEQTAVLLECYRIPVLPSRPVATADEAV